MEQGKLVLEDLIAPVTRQEFFAEYWETKYLHIAWNQYGRFKDLFSLRDIDRWLMSVRSGLPDSILLTPPQGSESGAERFRPQDCKIDHVYELFAKGHSVVLDYLEDSWPPVMPLVKALGESFNAQVGVNVYLTPKGSRTFPVHIDDHDVLVLQVEGEKVWRLHELKKLPVMRLDYKKDLSFAGDGRKALLEVPQIAELRLQPGDVLYVPRGMPHCAVARDSTSLHLTFSITPLYWFDFLKAAVEQAVVHAPELRRSLPPGFVGRPEACEEMRPLFDQVMKAFQEHVSFDETLQVVTRNRIRAHGFNPDGHFAHLNELEGLSPESVVERRESLPCAVEHSKDGFGNIRFGTRHVRGPERLIAALGFIRDHQRFQVTDLPGLDDQSRLVLVRRLIREGLLRFAEISPQASSLQLVAKSA
jgi:ribosomal protein L16 Arg81 hydroxylase